MRGLVVSSCSAHAQLMNFGGSNVTSSAHWSRGEIVTGTVKMKKISFVTNGEQ